MKNYKKILITLLASCIIYVVGWAQSNNAILKTLEPVHPRLFANDARIAAIKLQTDTVTKQLLFIIKADAEKRLTEPPINYPNGKSNMSASRNVQGRIITLALAYRLFDDNRFLQKAKEDLLQLAALNDWGLSHFLDVGEASLAAGIGYDWLYHQLSVEERSAIETAIKNNALLPSLKVEATPNNSSWVNGNFNWNPVCHGGLMVGALAIAERQPELSKQIVDRGLQYIPIAGDAYSPDGAFAEGPSYWSYGTSFYVFVIEALRTALGTTAGLEKIPGFLKTADYNVQMVGPTGQDFNYSDYHVEHLNEPVMLWFAKELNRPDLLTDEIEAIHEMYDSWLKKSNQQTGGYSLPVEGSKRSHSRHTAFEILWWNPSLSMVRVSTNQNEGVSTKQKSLQWTAVGLMPIGVMRSAWNDPKASFVAIKGGTPDNSHGHMDAGSFILEADGVRWAVDLGTESYDKMRAAKLDLWNYSQNSNRWSTFRCGPEGHNILRFNNERQLITGNGKIKQLPLKKGVMGNEADLTSLYADDVTKVIRTILLHPNHSFTIKDEWITKDNAVTYSFQWLTKATVTKTSYGLLLEQNGQSLQLKIVQPLSASDYTIEVEDVSQPKNIQDSPNPGLSRIVIKVKAAATTKAQLSIRAIPGSNVSISNK